MYKVCRLGKLHGRISPLCDNRELYEKIKVIAKNKGVDIQILIGITYAESHIGINFAPSYECSSMNNRAGLKAYKNDDGKTYKYNLPYSGCWLYPFKTIEDFFIGLANTLSEGYIERGCDNLVCLSKWYVGTPGEINYGWIERVEKFIYDK